MNTIWPLAVAAALTLNSPLLLAQHAHEHGVAHLQIAIEGNTVEASFDLPGHDLLGFEHAPATEAEKAAVTAAGERLKDAVAILRFSSEAKCTVAHSSFETETPEAGAAHVDFVAHYRFTCAVPAALAGFTTGLFKAFPSIGELAVQSQAPQGVREQALTASNPEYRF